MSLILDALKKAEAERRLGHAPTLATVSPWRVQRRGPRYAVLAAVLLLVALVTVFAALRWRGEQAPAAAKPPAPVATREAQSAAPAPAPPTSNTTAEESGLRRPPAKPRETMPAPAPAPADSAAVAAKPATPAPRDVRTAEPVRTVEAGRKPESALEAPKMPEIAALTPAPKAAPPTQIEPPPQKQPAAGPPSVAAPAAQPARPDVPAAQAEQVPPGAKLPPPPARIVSPTAPATATAASPAPAPSAPAAFSGGLSGANRAALGDLKLTLHYYNADKQRRFVILNGDRYSEGESTPKGLKVLEIRNDGVLLEYQGESFLLPRSGN